jgi:hypothetical protein
MHQTLKFFDFGLSEMEKVELNKRFTLGANRLRHEQVGTIDSANSII